MKILWATSSSVSLTAFKVKKNTDSWEKPSSIGLSSQYLKQSQPLDEKKLASNSEVFWN